MKLTEHLIRKPLLVVPLFCYLLAAVSLLSGAETVYQSVSSQGWPSTQGIVVLSKQETARSAAGRAWRSEPRARVRYSFSVDDKKYFSDQGEGVYFNQKNASAAEVADILARYPAGKQVVVYYDPNNPARSTLEPGIHDEIWDALRGVIVFVGAGLLLHLLFVRLSWI